MTKMFPPHRPKGTPTDDQVIRGYIEGYYGRLLRWDERGDIITHMAKLGMTAYLYAPKEDPYHRFDWRTAYDAEWQDRFSACCRHARDNGITMIGGVAPGLDYDYRQINEGDDWRQLLAKCTMMRDLGAGAIALMLDDIQPDLTAATGWAEGHAHATLANALYDALNKGLDEAMAGVELLLVPRIYADDVMNHDVLASGVDDAAYWPNLAAALNPSITLLVCGEYIIAPQTKLDNTAMVTAGISADRAVIWDNLYAHDYCPRRLFVGPWRGRSEDQHIMLNPTGMVATDKLLLSVMVAGDDRTAWGGALAAHGVPDAFHMIAHFFDLPIASTTAQTDAAHADGVGLITVDECDGYLAALEVLLWQWKSPLAQEWYPFLMGLKQDILYAAGRMDEPRARKSYPPILHSQLKARPIKPTF